MQNLPIPSSPNTNSQVSHTSIVHSNKHLISTEFQSQNMPTHKHDDNCFQCRVVKYGSTKRYAGFLCAKHQNDVDNGYVTSDVEDDDPTGDYYTDADYEYDEDTTNNDTADDNTTNETTDDTKK
ncbi:uncharacterized protein L201_003065 [Kwoniella dendrophila CBS 6074]|uniref:BED-type domain-containing protein n=1 Tax=Kwoniella dendrophila CBS 6074 TaxID=1295534 RepID=A0AAX4JUC0_9TREE